MGTLRRALYLEAAIWFVAGLALAVAPGVLVHRVFGQPTVEGAWLRVLGLQAIGLSMFMVLVAQRVEQVWVWAWAFALVTVGTAAVAVLHAAFGLAPGQPGGLWWGFAAVSVLLSAGLLWGLFRASQEQPFPP